MVKNLLISVCTLCMLLYGCAEYDADVAYLESTGVTNIAITDREHENLVAGVVGEKNKCKKGQRFWTGFKDKEVVSGCI